MKIPPKTLKNYQRILLKWFKENKRDFPWRYNEDSYKVLISEVLLQKTDAPKVLPVYKKFTKKYPSINSLQKAKLSDIKILIKDLGLMYRSDRLLDLGKTLSDYYSGSVPSDKKELIKIKGLGNYAASAVMCFAFNKREAIVDNNVVRVIERVFGFKSKKKRPREDMRLWKFAELLLPARKFKDYNYALLDFSALVCTSRNPQHEKCPLKKSCTYYNQNKKKKLSGIDLFAGAGGLSLGFEQAGFDIRYAIENDKHAAETYKRNRENNKDLIVDTRDIYNINPKEILEELGLKRGELDIVIGGPPCQGFSQSNMRTRNLANPQNQMVFKFIEFVNALKPKWFLMENVAGLNSLDKGKLKDLLIEEFKGMGYSTQSLILNSVNFGVPQSRNRIFFIGNRIGNDMKFTAALTNKSMRKALTVKDAISDLPLLINGNSKSKLSYNNRYLTSFQKKMRKGMNGKVQNNLTTRHSDLAITRFENIKQGENFLALAKKKPEMVANYKNVKNCHHWIYMRLPLNKPSVTLNNFRKNMLIHPTQNRGLSVREAARLQSFPDQYVFHGSIGFQQQQVSNAVPPLTSHSIARCIISDSFDGCGGILKHG